VARYLFKLMAYKDEYEVARLYTDGHFLARLNQQFEGDFKLQFHLAPPLLAARDPVSGELKKRAFGPWVFSAFKLLAKLKGLRGGRFDIFGYSAERRMERQLIEDYVALIDELTARLDADNHRLAVQLAEIPEHIRGFGHVKDRHLKEAKAKEATLLAAFRNPAPQASAAE
jgi:indolepyruvate ferredoxin oxidoreductase